ncbi:MAG: helix-turn-helix domain-containing protein [Streptosporangiales bacterium]|nr:helix-turn-helix domain-containing protein [Streptosporangiales bacterium]
MDDAEISYGIHRGQWRTWTKTPAPPLAGVDYHGFVLHTGAPTTDQVFPGPKLTVILSFGDPLRMEQMPGRSAGGTYVSFVAGLHAEHGVIGHDGHQAGVQVDLDPLVARAVFGMPPGELTGEVVPVAEVLGRFGDELAERLAGARGWSSRFALLDDVLARRLHGAPRPAPEVAHAWRRLLAAGGAVRVDELAGEVGWSRRHLGQRFQREFGLTPKAAARVVRFDRARWALARGGHGTLADVAATYGYYDHAHLDREFRALAGRPPTALGGLAATG